MLRKNAMEKKFNFVSNFQVVSTELKVVNEIQE